MPIQILIRVNGNVAGGDTKMARDKTTANEIALALAHLKLREKELLKSFESTTTGYNQSKKVKKK